MIVLNPLPALELQGVVMTDQSHIVGLCCDCSIAVRDECVYPRQGTVRPGLVLVEPESFESIRIETDMVAQVVHRLC